MSADNYLYVRKREDGKFGVSHRFASCYYADEGHTVESLRMTNEQEVALGGRAYAIDGTWIADPPEDRYGVFDTAEQALIAAHKAEERGWTEYGVAIGEGVLL